jgi:Predicted ATPase
LLLQEELRLNPTAAEYTYILKNAYNDTWLADFMQLMDRGDQAEINDFAARRNLLVSSMQALWRRLDRMRSICRFLDFNPKEEKIDVIDDLISDLLKGISVVVEFGDYDNMMSYLLVANIITRRVEEAYKKQTETYLRTLNEADKPKQLVITVEEAHKFLNPRAASQTSFGKIARELRKYYVSLLLVDQRPSGIDDEILSQIGTKIVAALSDEKDINAVLSGVSNAGGMRSILASLDTKQQHSSWGMACRCLLWSGRATTTKHFMRQWDFLTAKKSARKFPPRLAKCLTKNRTYARAKVSLGFLSCCLRYSSSSPRLS